MSPFVNRHIVFAAMALIFSPAAYSAAAEGEWVPLFNGQTLDGWEKIGRLDSTVDR